MAKPWPESTDRSRLSNSMLGNRNAAGGQGSRPNAQVAANNRKRPYEWYLAEIRRSARGRNIEFTLTYEDVFEFAKQNTCVYCGDIIVWCPTCTGPYAGRLNLDRKDSSKGYSRSNLVVSCWPCNKGKSAMFSYDEWKVMVAALLEFRRGRL